MRMNCNFPMLDESIALSSDVANVLVVEDKNIYSNIIYSLYQQENGIEPDYSFILFDDNFKQITTNILVLNPLTFDLNTPAIKKHLFTHITKLLDVNELQNVESMYNILYQYFNKIVLENVEIEITMNDAFKLEDVLKMMKLSIADTTSSIYERMQLILNVFHEFSIKTQIILCGTGSMVGTKEYNLIVETANMNKQRVLFIENAKISNLKNAKEFIVDKDYFCTEKML